MTDNVEAPREIDLMTPDGKAEFRDMENEKDQPLKSDIPYLDYEQRAYQRQMRDSSVNHALTLHKFRHEFNPGLEAVETNVEEVIKDAGLIYAYLNAVTAPDLEPPVTP